MREIDYKAGDRLPHEAAQPADASMRGEMFMSGERTEVHSTSLESGINKLDAVGKTDVGKRRTGNEDSFHVFTGEAGGHKVGLYVVADGMGGYEAGEVASQLAVDTVRSELESVFQAMSDGAEFTNEQLHERVTRAIDAANQAIIIYGLQHSEARNLGSTLTMALVIDNQAIVANVGDSRTLHMRNGEMQQVTRDHSRVAQLVAAGEITEAEIYSHPQRNLITSSLGHYEHVPMDIFDEALQPGDALVLCSDGLWEMTRGNDLIGQILVEHQSPNAASAALIDAANAGGGEDNITAIVVSVG